MIDHLKLLRFHFAQVWKPLAITILGIILLNFMFNHYSNNLYSLLWVVPFLYGNIFYSGTNNSNLRFLLTLPYSRSRIFTNKFLTVILLNIFCYITVILYDFIFSTPNYTFSTFTMFLKGSHDLPLIFLWCNLFYFALSCIFYNIFQQGHSTLLATMPVIFFIGVIFFLSTILYSLNPILGSMFSGRVYTLDDFQTAGKIIQFLIDYPYLCLTSILIFSLTVSYIVNRNYFIHKNF